ncbi:hypothetical protein AADZ13_005440 [Bacillus cereus]
MLRKIKRTYEEVVEIKVTVQVQHTYQYVDGIIVYFDGEAPMLDKNENPHHIICKRYFSYWALWITFSKIN